MILEIGTVLRDTILTTVFLFLIAQTVIKICVAYIMRLR